MSVLASMHQLGLKAVIRLSVIYPGVKRSLSSMKAAITTRRC